MIAKRQPDDCLFFIKDYAGRLWYPEKEEFHQAYFDNAVSEPEVGRFQLAENYYLEALPLLSLFFPENHISVTSVNCNIALIQIKQKRFDEAKNRFEFCEGLYKTSNEKYFRELVKESASELESAVKQ